MLKGLIERILGKPDSICAANKLEPIAVIPSGEDVEADNITSDELMFPAHPIGFQHDESFALDWANYSGESHYDSGPYTTYVDRKGVMHRVSSIDAKLIKEIDVAFINYVNPIHDMEAVSQAEEFTNTVKKLHQYPNLTDASVARSLGVDGFSYIWNDQGLYKLDWVLFQDGSSWER